jgi:hypothetical protein
MVVALLIGPSPVASQSSPPRIWDIPFGTPVDKLPSEEFVDPACGTNGGPPGLPIATFAQFRDCRTEPSGLREVWFRYDDELEYLARAMRDPDAITHAMANVVLNQPVNFSLLIDDAGLVQGYRIFTDPHAEAALRENAYAVAVAFKTLFGMDAWDCTEIAPKPGEKPIAATYINEVCTKDAGGDLVTVQSRYYYKAGQAFVDPHTGEAMTNAFESSASIEAVRKDSVKG